MMRYNLDFNVTYDKNYTLDPINDYVKAVVPGAVQLDYAKGKEYEDYQYNVNFKGYAWMEDVFWIYKSKIDNLNNIQDKQVFLCINGIDYKYEIFLNNNKLYSYEGMYKTKTINITNIVHNGDELKVIVYPAPKRPCDKRCRDEADMCVKPPVSYGWDWHPRLIQLGIWNDIYLEIGDAIIQQVNCDYDLTDDLTKAKLKFSYIAQGNYDRAKISLYDEDCLVYEGQEDSCELENPKLWWCNGAGKPNLYTLKASLIKNERIVYEKTIKIGIKKVELVMNEGAWDLTEFPKSRSTPPITIRLNNKIIYAKGTNFVSVEIFTGILTKQHYKPLVELAAQAHMNIFRNWGGAGMQKQEFYELCDSYGIMVWQEFPLACNLYPNDEHYLDVLDSESKAIINALKNHPCICLWCGGNELFNDWSKMTDQSYALRLLNKNCYDLDRSIPFIPTSPLMGMGHGSYVFKFNGKDVFEVMNQSKCTAYTEFGVPSSASLASLQKIIPSNELFPIKNEGAWKEHFAFDAWIGDTWLCLDTLNKYFGQMNSLKDVIHYSNILQCVGYKEIFEEARRQQPYCSMALNWCYNEPWINAANCNLVEYPHTPKPAYYAVQESLRTTLLSLKANRFDYFGGQEFTGQIYILNDYENEGIIHSIIVKAKIGDKVEKIKEFTNIQFSKNKNKYVGGITFFLPNSRQEFTLFDIIVECEKDSYNSRYTFLLKRS